MTRRLVEPRWRRLPEGGRARLRVLDTVAGRARTLVESRQLLLEAPSWSPDGRSLIVNAAGRLYRVDAEAAGGGAAAPTPIDTGAVDDANNDHVISPDGTRIFVSSESTGRLFVLPASGGTPREVGDDLGDEVLRFVLGISRDGTELYVTVIPLDGGGPGPDNVYAIPSGGGRAEPLTHEAVPTVGADAGTDWLYVNSERGGSGPGHSRIFRFPRSGGPWQQLTDGDGVDWFAKLSPDERSLAFVRFPPGTVGHETDRSVTIWAARPDGSEARELVRLRGGQGTMNVNSWAPDSRHLAYVDYPSADDA